MRSTYSLQQFRFQFRAVFLQVQNSAGQQSHFIFAVGEHNGFTPARFGNQPTELSFRVANGNRFHADILTFEMPSRKQFNAQKSANTTTDFLILDQTI